MENHTKGPWIANCPSGMIVSMSEEATGESSIVCSGLLCEDASRIVACVNACEGIETDRLEQIPKLKQDPLPIWTAYCEKKMQLEDVTKQRDESLAALELFIVAQDAKRGASGTLDIASALGSLDDAEEKARLAITKAKGGAA